MGGRSIVVVVALATAACGLDESGLYVDASAQQTPDVVVADTSAGDAATDVVVVDVIEEDAPVDAPPPPCNTSAPFGNVVNISGGVNSGAWEDSPALTDDELTMIFTRIPGSIGLVYATRPSISQPFGAASAVSSISKSTTSDTSAFVTSGLGALYFSSQRSGDNNYHLYQAAGNGQPDGWNNVQPLTALNTLNDSATETQPWLTSNAGVWFASNRLGTFDLYTAATTTTSPALDITLSTTSANEIHPVLSQDGLTIFFASDAQVGHYRVYAATRATVIAAFGAPSMLTAFDSGGSGNKPGWLSLDGCRMYFSSDRSGGKGNWDIWMASRP